MAVPDEEIGGALGAVWMRQHHYAEFDPEYIIDEGGFGSRDLFTPGKDYLVANNGSEMREQMRSVIDHPDLARAISEHGLKTIHQYHTCKHRVDELLDIYRELA